MIIRTPPRKRRADSVIVPESATSDRRLVINEDPETLESSQDPSDQMLCTYQCRQMVKSEFMDALGTAESQVHAYQSRLEALNNDLCKTEKRKFKDQFCSVEQEFAAAKGREHALQEQLLKEVNDSQERYQTLVKRCSELEVQLKKELDLRRNAESSVSTAEEKAIQLEEKLRQVSEGMEREKNRLYSDLLHLQSESKLSLSRINADLERMGCRANNAEKESELLKKQLEELREQLDECLHQKCEVDKKLSSLTALSQEVTSTDAHTLVKHLQEELRNCEADVREARKLKSSHVNNELLKEKLLEEKSRRERAEEDFFKLQAELLNVKKLEDELTSWKSIFKEIPGVSCCDDVPRKFAGLQKEVIESMMKVGEVSARLKELEVALEVTDLGKQLAETEVTLAKEKAEELMAEVKRLELMLSSVTEERDRLRNDSIGWKKQKSGEVESGRTNESLELESSLAEREATIGDLERNLHEQRGIINGQREELKLLHEKLNNEARRIKSLEREGDRLRSEISLLESKLGHGDYSAASTKVLRMVNTLAVDNEAKHTIEALQTELQRTRAKLQAVEDLKGQSDAGNLVDSQIPEKLAQLKAQIATLEKREERYKTVFAEKISVFRRACCSLFGYKIVMDDHQRPNGIPVTQFTLQSIYAQTDDEKLEFEYESGNMNILANEYTSQPELSRQVEIFIRKMSSIPAFTANLTVESFNRRTLS
ncbi:mitotic checkpoint family protein isoform X2 [Tasmannia lanceolata]|uniref:mitotic checkpoint family protein isoform X2 n=1 Tax=Tasmannia lanceolata TaxID=3420 RepID=UPI004063559B